MTAEGTTYTELAVSIGRVEAKVDAVSGMDERLRKVEQSVESLKVTVETIKANQPVKTPWYFVVAGVGGVITGIGGLIALVALFAKIR